MVVVEVQVAIHEVASTCRTGNEAAAYRVALDLQPVFAYAEQFGCAERLCNCLDNLVGNSISLGDLQLQCRGVSSSQLVNVALPACRHGRHRRESKWGAP
jgi:hypothetical protein